MTKRIWRGQKIGFAFKKHRVVVACVLAIAGAAGIWAYGNGVADRQNAEIKPTLASTSTLVETQEYTKKPIEQTVPSTTQTPKPTQPSAATGAGPNPGKLNKDGQMPSITTRRLVVSPSVLTYDGVSNSSTMFTVSTDDGRATSMPSGIANGCCFVAANDAQLGAKKSSWNVFLDMSGLSIDQIQYSAQSFVVPLKITADDGRGNEIQYVGSVTVTTPAE